MNSMLHLKLNPQRTSSSLAETMSGIKISSPVGVKTKKSVRFSEMCKVVLIPMRQEYSAAGIFLWWTKTDFLSFRQIYLTERQKEKALTSSTPTPTEAVSKKQQPSILIVTDQETSTQLMAQISSVMTSQPSFVIVTHEDVAAMSPGPRFDAVIVDGTEDCACFEINAQCPQHCINRLSTIDVIRSLSLSSNLTLFVNNSTIKKDSIRQLCSCASITSSDLMILTPDSWLEFQLLVESATHDKRIESVRASA
jgi:hypothetical protein